MIEQMANIFKALGEPTRLKIIKLLSIQEMCVCELVSVLDMSQPRISQHLKVLKNAGVIYERKDRQFSFFSLDSIIKAGGFSLFKDFMETGLGDLEDMDSENRRIPELENDAAVRECRGRIDLKN